MHIVEILVSDRYLKRQINLTIFVIVLVYGG